MHTETGTPYTQEEHTYYTQHTQGRSERGRRLGLGLQTIAVDVYSSKVHRTEVGEITALASFHHLVVLLGPLGSNLRLGLGLGATFGLGLVALLLLLEPPSDASAMPSLANTARTA